LQAIILAGGLGTRISEETVIKPKPLVEIGEWPILYHLMTSISLDGIDDFIICLGYKGFLIKKFFLELNYRFSDLRVKINKHSVDVQILSSSGKNWTITLVDTGINSNTAKRIVQVSKYIKNEPFLLTYGDGLSNVKTTDILKSHIKNEAEITVTAVKPSARFGALEIDRNKVIKFSEKNDNVNSWINGGYFIVNPAVLDSINIQNNESWESDILPKFAARGELFAHIHDGFWHPMDTLKDKKYLESLTKDDFAPWFMKNA
jgi:glucose-1-phosphate cytidylyltransferase